MPRGANEFSQIDSELRARKTKRALEEKVATVETQAVALAPPTPVVP
jgi:hypothetical protein